MNITITSFSTIRNGNAALNGEVYLSSDADNQAFFTQLYKHIGADYKKFYKMDMLSKLGYLASELITIGRDKESPKRDTSIILFNSSSSLDTDYNYQKTISDMENFFPSPSEFVYTLPNIVTGEIAIRNKIYGETSFYICKNFSAIEIYSQVLSSFADGASSVIAGWVEYYLGEYEALVFLAEKGAKEGIELTTDNINNFYK